MEDPHPAFDPADPVYASSFITADAHKAFEAKKGAPAPAADAGAPPPVADAGATPPPPPPPPVDCSKDENKTKAECAEPKVDCTKEQDAQKRTACEEEQKQKEQAGDRANYAGRYSPVAPMFLLGIGLGYGFGSVNFAGKIDAPGAAASDPAGIGGFNLNLNFAVYPAGFFNGGRGISDHFNLGLFAQLTPVQQMSPVKHDNGMQETVPDAKRYNWRLGPTLAIGYKLFRADISPGFGQFAGEMRAGLDGKKEVSMWDLGFGLDAGIMYNQLPVALGASLFYDFGHVFTRGEKSEIDPSIGNDASGNRHVIGLRAKIGF